MAQLDRDLASVASGQRMLVTREDVRRLGGAAHHIRDRVNGGRWRSIDDGVYAPLGLPIDWETRQLAAVLAAGSGALASHFAAARIWGIGFDRAAIEVSIPRGRRYRRANVRTHESTDLDRAGAETRNGIPVTGIDRTLLDIARYLSERSLARAIEAARRKDLVTWSSLIRVLVAHARRGRPGIQRLRSAILAGAHRTEVTDTDQELLVLSLINEAGLPEPVVHHRVLDGERFVAEVDLAYPRWKIAIECDGSVHLLAEVHERDLARQNDLVLQGWIVIRFSWDRIRKRPGVVGSEVRAAIRSREVAI